MIANFGKPALFGDTEKKTRLPIGEMQTEHEEAIVKYLSSLCMQEYGTHTFQTILNFDMKL